MAILDLYSKRQKRLRGEVHDVYCYDAIPEALRIQVLYILRDAIGEGLVTTNPYNYGAPKLNLYKAIHDGLAREYGMDMLVPKASRYREAVFTFIRECDNHERVLGTIELCFRVITQYGHVVGSKEVGPVKAIEELNTRFIENGVGYQFESGKIIRVDSQFLHDEAIKPALRLLNDDRFRGANDEFLKAHEHYRHGRYKECLAECLKAFESTMKIICDIRNWSYNGRDTASRLIKTCFDNGLIPNYLQSQFASLRTSLESGIPTVRNRLGGHGQGATPTQVPPYLASYLLHLTASSILLLVEAEKQLP